MKQPVFHGFRKAEFLFVAHLEPEYVCWWMSTWYIFPKKIDEPEPLARNHWCLHCFQTIKKRTHVLDVFKLILPLDSFPSNHFLGYLGRSIFSCIVLFPVTWNGTRVANWRCVDYLCIFWFPLHFLLGFCCFPIDVFSQDKNPSTLNVETRDLPGLNWYMLGDINMWQVLAWKLGVETKTRARWWIQIFFIFTPTWGRFPI